MGSPIFFDYRANPNMIDLINQGGQAQAEYARRQAEMFAGAFQGVGQAVGGAIQQHQEEKRLRKNEEAVLSTIGSYNPTEPDAPKKLLMNLTRIQGDPRKAAQTADAVVRFHQKDEGDAKSELEGMASGLDWLTQQSDAVAAQAWPLLRQRFAASAGKVKLPDLGEQWDPSFREQLKPTAGLLGAIAGKLPAKPLGQVVETVDAEGNPITKFATQEELEKGLKKPVKEKEAKKYEVLVPGPDGKPVKKLVSEAEMQAGVRTFEAERAPAYQSKEVLNDEGKAVMANFDARSGQYIDTSTGKAIKTPRPVPSATDSQDARKFKQAQPILSSISELSEKINTLQGITATAKGAEAMAKAKVNLDDNVAEYESLVAGFTPMVARALGHTGVLTEQDVQSVKALFPRPVDSKSLRDRKIKRMMTLIGALEAGATPGAEAPAASGGATSKDDLLKKYGY